MWFFLVGCLQQESDPVQPGPPPTVQEPVASTVEEVPAAPQKVPPPEPEIAPERERLLSLLSSLPPESLGEVAAYAPDGGSQAGVAVPLLKPVTVGGVPCTGTLLLEDAGAAGCKLSADHAFGELTLRRGAQVGFWWELGKIQRFTFFDVEPPRENLAFEGVLCMNAATLHATGHVARCVLAKKRGVDGVVVPKGSEILLNDQGELTGVVLYEPTKLDGRDHQPGTVLFQDGTMSDVLVGQF
ncbi:MAG: hypothetical protein ACI9VR_000232 [Cognaticolwellia sp.]|jgi:hypothetical protein